MGNSLEKYDDLIDLHPNKPCFIKQNKIILEKNDEIMKRNKIKYTNNIRILESNIKWAERRIYR